MAHTLRKHLCRAAVALMHQIRAYQLPRYIRQAILDLFPQREALNRLTGLCMPLLHIIQNVELERILSKVRLHRLTGRLKANCRIQVTWQVPEGNAQIIAVLGVEARVVDEVQAAADHVPCGESGSVVLACARAAERVSVVAMIAVGVLVPAGQAAQLHVRFRQTDAHVTVAAFAYNLYFVVVDATCWWNHVVSANSRRVLVGLAWTLKINGRLVNEGKASSFVEFHQM